MTKLKCQYLQILLLAILIVVPIVFLMNTEFRQNPEGLDEYCFFARPDEWKDDNRPTEFCVKGRWSFGG